MTSEQLLVVTGGNRGIGKQIALSAVDAGWRVAISYGENRDAADALMAGAGGRIAAFPLDVRCGDSVAAFFSQIDAQMGVPDALVTAAGIDLGTMAVADMTYEFVNSTMAVNVVGVILCCQEFASRAGAAGNGGVIVNISSMASTIGGRAQKTVYAASKGAVDVFSIGAAKELAQNGIAVFAVRPGVTRTDMTSARMADEATAASIVATIACGAIAEPEDIATPVIELISGKFAYASGSVLNLGGGGFVV